MYIHSGWRGATCPTYKPQGFSQPLLIKIKREAVAARVEGNTYFSFYTVQSEDRPYVEHTFIHSFMRFSKIE